MIKARLKELARFLGIPVDQITVEFTWPEHVHPYQIAPVVIEEEQICKIIPMRFSLLPSWAKEPRVKFSTHNARMDSLESKATWKRPFLSQRCLVPITHFIEPIYFGNLAGKMVQFRQRDNSVMLAAGIYDRWTSPENKEVVSSFAIITSEPSDFVAKTGHDRQPVFLDPAQRNVWITGGKMSADELKSILIKSRAQLDLEVEPDRDMKPGWEKRRDKKLEAE